DIVVCGADTFANCREARRVETAVGPCYHDRPHAAGGLQALPHWQQRSGNPAGHSFYETNLTKALPLNEILHPPALPEPPTRRGRRRVPRRALGVGTGPERVPSGGGATQAKIAADLASVHRTGVPARRNCRRGLARPLALDATLASGTARLPVVLAALHP